MGEATNYEYVSQVVVVLKPGNFSLQGQVYIHYPTQIPLT